ADYVAEFGGEFPEFAAEARLPAELIEAEFLARHALPAGDAPAVEEYLARFPDRADVAELLRARCLGGGRYIKLRPQGQGGMGRVWLAYDRHLRRPVAVKEPRPGRADDDGLLARLAAEARATAGLEHPAIVTVHELHEPEAGTPFYVMRLVRGTT